MEAKSFMLSQFQGRSWNVNSELRVLELDLCSLKTSVASQYSATVNYSHCEEHTPYCRQSFAIQNNVIESSH